FVERVTYPDLKAAKFPNLAKASDEDLLKHITSRSQVARVNAMDEILKRGEKSVFVSGLETIIKDKNEELYNRVASLFALKQLIGSRSHKLLVEVSSDLDLREFAIRALADRTDQLEGIPQGFIAKFLKDENPRVRLQAVTALARLKDRSAVNDIFTLAQSEKMIVDDRLKQVSKVGADGSLSAPISALPHVSLRALMILADSKKCLELLDDESKRETALRILQTRHTEDVVGGLISKLESSSDEHLKKLVMLALFRLYHSEVEWDGKSWWNTRPNYKGPYFKPTEWAQTPKIKSAIEKAYPTFSKDSVREIMSVMRLNQILPSSLALKIDFDEVVDLLTLESLTAAQGATLINAAMDKKRSNKLKVQVFHKLDSVAGIDTFVEKVKLLKAWNADKTKNDLLKSTYTDFVNTTRYVSDVKSLGLLMKNRRSGIGIYAHIIAFNMLRNPVVSEDVKSKLKSELDEVISHERQAESTAKALIQFENIADLISKEQFQKLAENGRKAVRTNFKKIKALYKTVSSKSGDLVSAMSYESLKKEIAKPGNELAAGKALFIRQGCSICHTVDESIAPKGPFLGSVGTKFSREFIAESIVKPSAVMAQGFVTKWFKLKDGTTVEGFVTGYDGPAFEIRNVAGIVSKIEKTQIVESGVRETSMMPLGLAGNLTVKEFNALLDYLQSLK
ncbi:MAG: HEAT repeat domain-containing protein, partial [Lentisphaeraceae bacterium]|nr:HEAT repeat domain-containing protein [Lentisphaeraceae bacterium]